MCKFSSMMPPSMSRAMAVLAISLFAVIGAATSAYSAAQYRYEVKGKRQTGEGGEGLSQKV